MEVLATALKIGRFSLKKGPNLIMALMAKKKPKFSIFFSSLQTVLKTFLEVENHRVSHRMKAQMLFSKN